MTELKLVTVRWTETVDYEATVGVPVGFPTRQALEDDDAAELLTKAITSQVDMNAAVTAVTEREITEVEDAEDDTTCDECGALVPSTGSLESPAHLQSCSLYPHTAPSIHEDDCAECGERFTTNNDGTTTHVDGADADRDHVPYADPGILSERAERSRRGMPGWA